MSDLRATQEAMHAALHGEDASRLRERAPAATEARIEVYRSMYWSRQVESLADDFPRVRSLLGEALFERVAATHVRRHPSRHASLAWLGRDLPETLTNLGLTLEAGVASLEWSRLASFWSRDEVVATPAALGALGDRLGEAVLAFHPSLHVVRLSAQARRVEAGDPVEPVDERPQAVGTLETVVTWREGTRVEERLLLPLEAAALDCARAGHAVATVCEVFLAAEEPEGAAIETLLRWVTAGWVTAAVCPSPFRSVP